MPHKSFLIPAIGLVVLALGYIVFGGIGDNLVYYLNPTEAIQQRADHPDGDRFRLGGFVEDGSVVDTEDGLTFVLSDDDASVAVHHTGSPPQLFREGIGVIVEGAWNGDVFETDTLIIKHDEEYRSTDDETPYVPPTGSEG